MRGAATGLVDLGGFDESFAVYSRCLMYKRLLSLHPGDRDRLGII